MQQTTVALLDNDVWALLAIGHWIDQQPHCTMLWSTSSYTKAIHRCLYANAPQLMLVDMSLGAMTGAAFCRQIRWDTPDISLLGITAYDTEQYIEDLAKAGAQGIVNKDKLFTLFPHYREILMRGECIQPEVFMGPQEAYRYLHEQQTPHPGTNLSPREIQVLRLYARGHETSDIAQELGISKNSVFTFINRASHKLGVHSCTQAIQKGRQYGLFE